jgi:hypothetical protein
VKWRWRGLAIGVLWLVIFSMLVPCLFKRIKINGSPTLCVWVGERDLALGLPVCKRTMRETTKEKIQEEKKSKNKNNILMIKNNILIT